jgi:AAA family ATP:ADP antiporter
MSARDESTPSNGPTSVGWLRGVVDVRSGETLALVASMVWIFLALTAYYVIKPLRSAVLQEKIGVDNKWLALGLTTIFIGFFAYGYGKLVPRVPRNRLIVFTFLVFVLCLGAFALFLPKGGAVSGYVFFVWVSTFNLMIVSQFWSLAADVWSKEQGVRLFGFIGVGGVAGGIFGTLVVSRTARSLSTEGMLLLAAGLLLCCLLLASYVLQFGARSRSAPEPEREADRQLANAPSSSSNSLMLVLGSPYLRSIALMMLLLNLVNTSNEWVLDKMVARSHLSGATLKEFYAEFYLLQNAITFGIQFFLTARIQRRFGAGTALLCEPLVGIVGGVVFAAVPALRVIKWHKILENAADYSIQTNTKELLYLPVSRLEKYSAKSFNDTFVVRGGDALAAALIFIATLPWLQSMGELGLRILIGFNVLLGLLWVWIAVGIGRQHRLKMAESPAGGSER